MVIRNEIERLALFLQVNGGPHHPEIISEMQRAAGLDAGQNSHGGKVSSEFAIRENKNGFRWRVFVALVLVVLGFFRRTV